jgi:hypothetical protein
MQVIYPQLDGVRINENRTLPTAVIQAIRKAYDYIAQISTTTSLGTVVIEDTHANRQILHSPLNLALGSFYIETDRNEALYVVQTVKSANAWVLVTGAMRGVVASRPADLTTNDVGFFYVSTDSLDYRWSGSAWTVLDTVKGGGTLTTVSAIPKVTATGILGPSAITDDGSEVLILSRQMRQSRVSAPALTIELTATPADANSIAGVTASAADGTVTNSAGGTINFRANGLWTIANHGTDIQFRGISNGSTTLTEWARFRDGNLGLGGNTTPAEAMDATGDANVSGVYKVAGTQVVSTRGAALTATGAALAGAPVAYSQAYTTLTTQLANNLKTRVDELEARLQAHGLIS